MSAGPIMLQSCKRALLNEGQLSTLQLLVPLLFLSIPLAQRNKL